MIYILLIVIIVIVVIEYVVYKKNRISHYVNYLKYTETDSNISLEDSNIYVGNNPKDECIQKENQCESIKRINTDSIYGNDFHKLICTDEQHAKILGNQSNTSNIDTCITNKKCKTVILPKIDGTGTKGYCKSENDINVENDLVVNDYLLLGDTTDHQVKIDINLLRKIKNLPYHFDKTNAINNDEETICLVNGPVDLPRCVEDEIDGKYYIKVRGGDETRDIGYDNTKDCKYKIGSTGNVADTAIGNSTGVSGNYIQNSKFRNMKHCKDYLKNNYQTIKNNTDTDQKIQTMCPTINTTKNTDDRISCIQKHHIEMLKGERPIALRTFGNVYPFTFFKGTYNALPRIKRGMENNDDFQFPPGSNRGPKSVNVKKNYTLKVYSGQNYTGSSKTIQFPGSKNVGFPNGIRSYKTQLSKPGTTEKLEYGKAKHICVSKHEEVLPPTFNANKSKTNVFTVKPCSYDDTDQLFYLDIPKENLSGEHSHSHIHNTNDTH